MGKVATRPTKTIHIRADVHRVLRQLAAHEECKIEDVTDRVLRHALNLPSDTSPERQQDLTRQSGFVPEALRR